MEKDGGGAVKLERDMIVEWKIKCGGGHRRGEVEK